MKFETEADELLYYLQRTPESRQDVLALLSCIQRDAQVNPEKLAEELYYLIREDCRENDICPECFSHMAYNRVGRELIGEFWGAPAYEDRYVLQCPECGYEEE